jgi:integrase
MPTTYDVRIWKTEKYEGQRFTSYSVRWKVGSRSWRESFRNQAQAESFRSEIVAAARRGEAFDTETGRPAILGRIAREMSWYQFACDYVDMKWKPAAGKYRRSIAEALTTVTPVMLTTGRGRPDDRALRLALTGWAFNSSRRGDPDRPAWIADALRWVENNTRPVSSLAQPQLVRAVLDELASRLDRGPAAATTVNRKRAVLSNALSYAVELELLAANPIDTIKWRPPRSTGAIDRRAVINPVQARSLLRSLGEVPAGDRYVAFFAVMYFAALRPEEAVNLHKHNLSLPTAGWGELAIDRATPDTGRQWTDSGRQRDERQLKHRGRGEVRTVPCAPELVAILREHLAAFGTDAAGRLFHSARGGAIGSSTYGRMWDRARQATFTQEAYSSPLGKRPYDLRHAAVSTWLNGGVPPTQVAEWAGHSVEVLLRVYAKCLDGQQEAAKRRVEAALGLQLVG